MVQGGRAFLAFQHVAQRVLALDGHPSGGAGSDSDDWLKDSRSTSQISGRRLSAGLLGRGRLRSDYRRSQRVFRFLLQFDRTRRCLRAVLGGIASPSPVPSLSRLSAPTRSHPKQPPRSSPPCLRAARCPPPNGPVLPRAKSEGRADFCARWRVRGAPPISPRAALSGTALLRIDEELTAAGEIDQAAGQIDHPPAVDCPQTA